eukprot:CAMPEP_0171367032 /NCGR_PEP_ID=MMETSP0879-20121228/5808_1 /TAXON_ID=67004 /ORGANISM="Thalassiosira weissflogii, Strain CCMP1336" /LENGTH=714 /DNA_ID=CAMNT_0011874987 /DNA_START=22 /DNA_END=2166 /DNA_ORIENTATION=-
MEGRISTKAQRIKKLRERAFDDNGSEVYMKYSKVEEKCNCYVSGFLASHPNDNHPLIINPENEYGSKRFVCTFIRPTIVPYPELHDCQKCAEFVARFVDYEPLAADEFPTVIASPAQTLSWAVGDCFEMSILLVSLLRGANFDAYVVAGLAPMWIRQQDQTHMQCNLKERSSGDSSYPCIEISINDENFQQKIASVEGSLKNSLGLHSWVLVKPSTTHNLSHTGAFFVETSTGVIYPVDESPYNQLYCVWNDDNYWVNVNDESEKNHFDLENRERWVAIFPGVGSNSSATAGIICAPPCSWVNIFEIPKDKFQRRYPSGTRSICLDRAKIELFGSGVDIQGLQARVIFYEDVEKTILHECTEIFEPNRRMDYMTRRVRAPEKMEFEEFFSLKNRFAIKAVAENAGVQRGVTFYSKTRADGLRQRVEELGLFTESFEHRSDSLSRRQIFLASSTGEKKHRNTECLDLGTFLGTAEVTQINDYFRPPNDKASFDSCVASRLFKLNDGNIITTFGCENEVLQRVEVSNSSNDELRLLQKKAIKEVESIKKEMNEIQQILYSQQASKNLAFPTQEEVIVQPYVQNEKDHARNGDDVVDYLAPYLMQVDSKMPLSKEEAKLVRDACLRGYKERLIERGNIMQARLDMARRELLAFQETHQAKRGRTLQEKEAYENFCSDQTFKMKVLERRIILHEQNAIAKFKALESKLNSDDRLKSLH